MTTPTIMTYTEHNRPRGIPQRFNREGKKTQDHYERETNINTIVAKYKKTGFLGDPAKIPFNSQQYGDFGHIASFHEANNLILTAQDAFKRIPAAIRARFKNDPQIMMTFVDNPQNQAECVALGLIPAPKQSIPQSQSAPTPETPVAKPATEAEQFQQFLAWQKQAKEKQGPTPT